MRLALAILLLFFQFNLLSQESPGLKDVVVDSTFYKPVHKYRAIGLTYQTTRDEALSPLIFQGPGVAYSGYTRKYSNKWLWQSEFITQIQLMRNKPATSLLSEVGFSYRISALRELPQLRKGRWHFWIGPEARMFLNMRLHSRNVNNVAAYDWATALGASAMVSNQFKLWGRTFAISNQLQFPLIFLYARPPYAWGIPPAIYEEQDGSWKEAFQFGTLNDILLLANQVNFDFYLRKRRNGKLVQYRAWRIAYSWSYFQVVTNNNLQTGGHQLGLSRVITF